MSPRTFILDSPARMASFIKFLGKLGMEKPWQVQIGSVVHDKTHEQRKKFHAICRDIGLEIGLTPGQVKMAIKQEQFGIDEFKMGEKWYRGIKSSEDTDRLEYSELIEAAYRWGAENGVAIPDYDQRAA